MKGKEKHVFILVVVLVLFLAVVLASCGGDNSQKELDDAYYSVPKFDTSSYNKEELNEYNEMLSRKELAYADSDVEALYALADEFTALNKRAHNKDSKTSTSQRTQFFVALNKTFDFEDDGYTGSMVFKSWYGILGTGGSVVHPADSSISIPQVDTKSMVLPFYVEVHNTTSDTSFKQDMHIIFENPIWTNVFYLFEDGSWIGQDNYGKINRVIRGSSGGEWMRFYGYSVVTNVVKPNSPEPDLLNMDQSRREFNITINPYISDTYGLNSHEFCLFQDEMGIAFQNGKWSGMGDNLVFKEE